MIVDELDVNIEVSLNPTKIDVLKNLKYLLKVICIIRTSFKSKTNINRVGCNAADRVLICG